MPETLTTTPLDVLNVTREITSSKAWHEARTKVETDKLPEREKVPTAIRMAAVALRGKEEGQYMTLPEHALNITAHLTTFEDTVRQLEHLRARHAKREQKEPYILKTIAFNDAVKEMIDSNPRLKYNEVVQFMRNMNQKIHGRHDDRLFNEQLHEVLQGVRNELAFEQITGYIDGIELDRGTPEEDLDGADYFVREEGDKDWYPVDVKATFFTAEKSRRAAESAGEDSSYIVWSQLTPEDFDAGFRISPELAKHKAPALERELRHAILTQKQLALAS